MSKFKKPESNPLLNPVDYFNFFGTFEQIFEGDKKCISYSNTEATYQSESTDKSPTFILTKDNLIDVKKSNPYDLATGQNLSKFMLLTAIKFKGDYFQAMSHVSFNIMKNDIPYIRVGTDYFKVIKKEDRYSGTNIILKGWKKDEIKEDHTKTILSKIYKFDDFTILPNNKTFIPAKNNCYNLYSKFPHIPFTDNVHYNDIPITTGLMDHIFGEQINLGFKYMKILYENPCQILPVLALVSTERETGKTTFLNYIQMLIGIYDENRFLAGTLYRFPNGSFIKFIGLDKSDVGKGLRSDVAYFNEVNKIDFESYRQVASRAGQVYADYNPDSEFYIDSDVIKRDDCDFLQLTFRDNELLSENERNEILMYKTNGYNENGTIKNEYWANLWNVYGLGNIGNLQGVVFNNWAKCDAIPNEAEFIAYGIDWGFTSDPTTLTAVYRYDSNLYLDELIYETGLTNSDIIKKLTELGVQRNQMIVADSAEPKSIEDLRRAGFRIEGAKKGPDSIRNSIDTLQQQKIFITTKSTNAIKEAYNYRWATDSTGKNINVPEDRNNHFWDSVRYVALNRLKKSTFFIQ